MEISKISEIVCPIDGLILAKEAGSLRCASGHTYDFAREGYCNLLLVQKKKSADPGDSKEMVEARGRFLEAGYFEPIAEKSFDFVHTLVVESSREVGKFQTLRIVDAGCGEGYYLQRFSQLAAESANPARLELAGFDISKWAVRAAAKRAKNISWAVASNLQVPFPRVDLILSLFGFPVWESFRRVQEKGGLVLLVDPGPGHLSQLRKVIYPEVRESEPPAIDEALSSGYTLVREETLQFEFGLDSAEAIADLLAMTPHAFRIGPKGAQDLARLSHLDLTADLRFRLLEAQ